MRDADVDAVVTAFGDPLISLWNPSTSKGEGSPRDRALQWIRDRSDWSTGDHCSWGIYLGVGGALLGTVSLHHLDLVQSTAEIGYWTLPSARGLWRLQLYHAVENAGSCRVAEKAGFALEGQLRKSFRFGDGRFHDEHLHARLASDPELQGRLRPEYGRT
jgi:RimJ/RimL family protein N-acetyltransferase